MWRGDSEPLFANWGPHILNIYQVRTFYKGKKHHLCPITDRLVKSGYQQSVYSDGYTRKARQDNLVVDYKQAKPTQWWHLNEAYCRHKDDDAAFKRSIQCGELILWMAEVAECVGASEMNMLVDEIIRDQMGRRNANKRIRDLCFDKIADKVEGTVPIK
jgi:hypothetical protein